ncbi:hypothetical protein [Pedobacter namyangjuensis]|uniref:hypothetical protein n=1 Tax=Pedobacter namyangjuensis TaxID=600626 RepID=UPI000DE1BAC1|nr:hypothetical protein [Pedobacter namyangjuensis]
MKKLKFTVACVLFATGLSSFIYWFSITAKDISFEAMQAEYSSAFPSFLQNSILQSLVVTAILVTAAVLFIQSRSQKGFKIPATSGLVLSFLFAFWQIFSLM